MQLIAPEIVAEFSGLSWGLSLIGFLLGLALWLTGWAKHKFWVVLSLTLTAGLVGMVESATLQSHPLVAGVLFAVAGGILALNLVQLIAFLAGGSACLILCKVLAPALDQPLMSFMAGGMLGITLFRLWWMTLTSCCGTLLIVYSGLALLERFARMDAPPWSERNGMLLNWICGALALVGLILQFWLSRGKKGDAKDDKKKDDKKKDEKKAEAPKPFWYDWMPPVLRKAG